MAEVRSNLDHWKKIQDDGYFETHPCYEGLRDFGSLEAVSVIEWFAPVEKHQKVAVIGCGYGRESLGLAQRVAHVYGIDVNDTILNKAKGFLESKGVQNFTPVLAERYGQDIPDGIDIVFSIVVMQHLTRDLARDYFLTLSKKLNPNGFFVVQFIQAKGADLEADVDLSRPHEPSISYGRDQLEKLAQHAGLRLEQVKTLNVSDDMDWHWTYFKKL